MVLQSKAIIIVLHLDDRKNEKHRKKMRWAAFTSKWTDSLHWLQNKSLAEIFSVSVLQTLICTMVFKKHFHSHDVGLSIGVSLLGLGDFWTATTGGWWPTFITFIFSVSVTQKCKYEQNSALWIWFMVNPCLHVWWQEVVHCPVYWRVAGEVSITRTEEGKSMWAFSPQQT